jgi:mono/diheme cytochrome c family protein
MIGKMTIEANMTSICDKHSMNAAILSTLLLGFSLLTSGCSANQSDKAAAEKTTPISAGHQLFLTNCSRCHAGDGNPPGPDNTILSSGRLSSEESFRKLLRQPTSAMMKSFSPQELSDMQVHTLYEYIIQARKTN